jgi:hypothetical protein
MFSLVDQLTALSVFVDDSLWACSALAQGRRSLHHTPAFADTVRKRFCQAYGFLCNLRLGFHQLMGSHEIETTIPIGNVICEWNQPLAFDDIVASCGVTSVTGGFSTTCLSF